MSISGLISSKVTGHLGPVAGGFSAAAVLRGNYADLPLIVVVAVITASLLFGILAKIGRTPPKSIRNVLLQSGALWIIAFWMTETYASSLAGAALICLGIGLGGGKALDIVERLVMAGLSKAELVFLSPALPPKAAEPDDETSG